MKPQHLIIVLLFNVALGCNIVAGKTGVENMSPLFFAALRFSLLAIVLLPALKIIRGQMHFMILIGLTGGVLHFVPLFLALHLGNNMSSLAVLSQLHIPFSTLLAVLFLGEHISQKQTVGIAIAFIGAMIIGIDPTIFTHWDAIILIIISALAYSAGTIIVRNLQGVGVFQIQAWLGIICAPTLLLLSYIFEDGQQQAFTNMQFPVITALLYSVFIASFIGHGGIYYLLRRYPVTKITPYMLLTPVVSVIAAIALLNETLTWQMVIGSIVTLSGIALITIRKKKSITVE